MNFERILCIAVLMPLFASSTFVHAREISKLEQEELFNKGLLSSCRADLKVLQIGKNSFSNPGGGIESCNQQVLSLCKLDLAQAKKVVAQKIKYLGDQTQAPSFAWNDTNKKIYFDAVLRKLCSGGISEESLKDYDALFFLNTECTGDGYLEELDRLKMVSGIHTYRATKICQTGANVSSKISLAGKDYWTRFLVINPISSTTGLFNGDDTLDNLNATLVHEFVHHQRQIDAKFKQWSDQFLNLRFYRLQKDYLQELDKVETDINTEANRLEKIPGSKDAEREQQIATFANRRIDHFRDWLTSTKVPFRHGMGSSISSWGNGKMDDKPGQFSIVGLPTFKNGKPSKFEFGDHVRNSDRYTVWVLDSYPLKNKEEYLAIVLEIYWHKRLWAEQMLSKEELQWLDKKFR